jgi:hypothetical protein
LIAVATVGLSAATSASAASAATVDAGSLRAETRGGSLSFTQPGSPRSSLKLAGTTPAGL